MTQKFCSLCDGKKRRTIGKSPSFLPPKVVPCLALLSVFPSPACFLPPQRRTTRFSRRKQEKKKRNNLCRHTIHPSPLSRQKNPPAQIRRASQAIISLTHSHPPLALSFHKLTLPSPVLTANTLPASDHERRQTVSGKVSPAGRREEVDQGPEGVERVWMRTVLSCIAKKKQDILGSGSELSLEFVLDSRCFGRLFSRYEEGGGGYSFPHERVRSEGEKKALFYSSLTTSSPPSHSPLPRAQTSNSHLPSPPPPQPTQKAIT